MNFKALGNFGPVLRNVSLVLRRDYPGNGFKLLSLFPTLVSFTFECFLLLFLFFSPIFFQPMWTGQYESHY